MKRMTTRVYGKSSLVKGMSIFDIKEAVDRLAAYEDTGLEPEEIVELMGRLNVIDFNWHDSPGEPGPPGIATDCD